MAIALIVFIIVTLVMTFFVYNLLKGIDDRDERIAKRDERLQDYQSEIYKLRDQVDTWRWRAEHQESTDLDEGEDYVRSSLGLPSDDEQEIALIAQVITDHEGTDTWHLAERISTALNGRHK
jgi:type II secretory pathway pseudopilin PulG